MTVGAVENINNDVISKLNHSKPDRYQIYFYRYAVSLSRLWHELSVHRERDSLSL